MASHWNSQWEDGVPLVVNDRQPERLSAPPVVNGIKRRRLVHGIIKTDPTEDPQRRRRRRHVAPHCQLMFSTGSHLLEAHLRKCQLKRCNACCCIRNVPKWERRLQILPPNVADHKFTIPQEIANAWAGRSWLAVSTTKATTGEKLRFRVGCAACRTAGVPPHAGIASAYAKCRVRTPQIKNLMKHHESALHKESVRKMLGLSPLSADDNNSAPSAEDFAKVWDMVRNHDATGRVEGVGGRKKCNRMKWCLWQGMRAMDMNFLDDNALDMSIHQVLDERKSRLLCRFIASNSKLYCRHGILGLQRGYGSGSKAIVAATDRMLKIAATNRWDPPVAALIRKDANINAYDPNMYKHLCYSFKTLNVDSAKVELLAGQMMQGEDTIVSDAVGVDPVAPMLKSLAPNLNLIERGRAHATRRCCLK